MSDSEILTLEGIAIACLVLTIVLLCPILSCNGATLTSLNSSAALINKTATAVAAKAATAAINKTITAATHKIAAEIAANTTNTTKATVAAINKNITAAVNKAAFSATHKIAAAIAANTTNNKTKIVTTLLGNSPENTAMSILIATAFVILIPLVSDLVLAHRRQSKQVAQGSTTTPTGMPGLYRALMTFGIIIIVGTIVFYVIGLVIANSSIAGPQAFTGLLNILQNLSAILGTALASVIAFYFGSRASEKAKEKSLDSTQLDNLEKLSDLKQKGVITEEEFQRLKGELLK